LGIHDAGKGERKGNIKDIQARKVIRDDNREEEQRIG
jgi:hypothetical protein